MVRICENVFCEGESVFGPLNLPSESITYARGETKTNPKMDDLYVPFLPCRVQERNLKRIERNLVD